MSRQNDLTRKDDRLVDNVTGAVVDVGGEVPAALVACLLDVCVVVGEGDSYVDDVDEPVVVEVDIWVVAAAVAGGAEAVVVEEHGNICDCHGSVLVVVA